MLTVHNFLAPSVNQSPADVITEAHPYGPDPNGFKPYIALDLAETFRPIGFVQAMVGGFVRIENSDASNPESAVQLLLTPVPTDSLELERAASDSGMMNPTGFRYSGIELASLEEELGDLVRSMDADPMQAITENEKWQAFLDGVLSFKVDSGRKLGLVAEDVSSGERRLSFQVVVRGGHLDPVAVFKSLLEPQSYIDIVGTQNSWLDVATQNRILVSLRDEWDEPLGNNTTATITWDNSSGSADFFLKADNNGTLMLGITPGNYVLAVGSRSLTVLSHLSDAGSENTHSFNFTESMHLVLGSVNAEDWFAAQNPQLTGPQALSRYTEGNSVEYLIDGNTTYRALVSDLKLISNSTHFAFFSNWWMDVDFELLPGVPVTTIRQIATAIAATGARTRALLWDQWLVTLTFSPSNVVGVELFNSLVNGVAILDRRTHHSLLTSNVLSLDEDIGLYDPFGIFAVYDGTVFHAGAHHWKCTIIRNAQSSVAYLGGIDINPNRLDDQSHGVDAPYHDVHCRILGPAVRDVTKAFVDRWNDHPDRGSALEAPDQLLGAPSANAGTCMVQIARTYGADTQSYAPFGDRTIWATLERAINRAKNYIYIEDQYLTSEALSEALENALDRIDHLIILIDEVHGLSRERWNLLRRHFLKPLFEKAEEKVHVFKLDVNNDSVKIHTKSVIIDDIFATIGSANMGRRSLTHDSEINAFMLDGAISNGRRKFARDYRVALWAEHLGWHNQPDVAEANLGDMHSAINFFLNDRPSASRIREYDLTPNLLDARPLGWQYLEDPDGSLPPT